MLKKTPIITHKKTLTTIEYPAKVVEDFGHANILLHKFAPEKQATIYHKNEIGYGLNNLGKTFTASTYDLASLSLFEVTLSFRTKKKDSDIQAIGSVWFENSADIFSSSLSRSKTAHKNLFLSGSGWWTNHDERMEVKKLFVPLNIVSKLKLSIVRLSNKFSLLNEGDDIDDLFYR